MVIGRGTSITERLAQPIRLLLNYVGEEFEDVYYELGDAPDYSTDSWNSVKESLNLDFPNIPYYIDGETRITQSNTILTYLGRKYKLDGSTEKEKALVDMMLNQAYDLRMEVVMLCYSKDYDSLKEGYFKNIKAMLALFEKKLGDHPWFVGENITVCDFPIYELLDQHRLMKEDSLQDFPKLLAFLKRFEELPNIKKYMASDKFLRQPVNNKMAGFK